MQGGDVYLTGILWPMRSAIPGEEDEKVELGSAGRKDEASDGAPEHFLSSIIVEASKQASDSVPRVDRDHRFIPRRRVDGWFLARAEELAKRLADMAKVTDSATREPDLALLDGAGF